MGCAKNVTYYIPLWLVSKYQLAESENNSFSDIGFIFLVDWLIGIQYEQ